VLPGESGLMPFLFSVSFSMGIMLIFSSTSTGSEHEKRTIPIRKISGKAVILLTIYDTLLLIAGLIMFFY